MHRGRLGSTKRRSAEGGYSMVILIMIVTTLTVMTAVALPLWTAMGQREREEELIFRGLQYAEAIRVFQRRFGRYPVRLKELIEVKPRCIRQLYTDPMNEEGQWGLIFATGGATRVGSRQQQQRAEQSNLIDQGAGTLPESDLPQSHNLFGNKKETVGPISGVHSTAATEKAFKTFQDQDQYEQWAFTVDLVSGIANAPDRPPQVPSAKTLGRPFRKGLTPLVSFAQGGTPGSGKPGANRGPAGGRAGPGSGTRPGQVGRTGGRFGGPPVSRPTQGGKDN